VALARADADVAIIARTHADLNKTAALVNREGADCYALPADLTDAQACERVIGAASVMLGPPDILINNAGGAKFKPVQDYTAEELDWHYHVNYRAMHLCSRAVLPVMMRRGSGTIINIASSSGRKPYRNQGAYCAMKAAVIALSKVMALELREHGVRVHVICPGAVDTAMADQVHPERDRTGWMQPEDVAQVVLDLLSLPPHLTVDEVVMRRYLAEPM
jgi:NADP-dependent 3-hydroxy acid dehydrogenase YdfG